MATHMLDRSTYWVKSGGSSPKNTGDYRCYWKIYYDTEKDNRRTKFTFKYCVQVHYTDSSESGYYQYQTPSTSSVVYINGKSIGSKTIPSKVIKEGTSWYVVEVASATTYINHNPDGSASFTFRGTGFGLGTATSTYSTSNGNFPTVPAYNMLGDIQTFDIDDGVTIPITRYVSSYYDKLEILHGEDVLKTVNNISSGFAINTPTNAQVTFTETELDNIYTKVSTGSSTTFTIKLTTYSDSGYTTVIGSNSKSVTGNFNILLPTFSDFSYYDSFANAVNNLTGSSQTIIRHVSDVYITIDTNQLATANTRKASISHYVINGTTIKSTGSAISYNLGHVENNGVTVQAVDTRGTASIIVSKKYSKFIEYEYPNIPLSTVSVKRSDNEVGKFIEIELPGTWWNGNFGKINNALSFFCEYYKTNDDTTYYANVDNITITTDGSNNFIAKGTLTSKESDQGFDVNSSYYLRLAVIDEANYAYTVSGTMSPGEPGIAFYKNKVALGNKYDESLGGTQLWGDVYLNGSKLETHEPYVHKRHIVSAYLDTAFEHSFTAWTSVDVPLDVVTTIGDKLSFSGSNVYIGKGVSKVLVSGSAYFGNNIKDTQLRAWTRLKNTNDEVIFTIPSYTYAPDVGCNMLISIPPVIMDVSEGQKISLMVQIGKTQTGTVMTRGTTLYVEVIE